MQPTRRDELMRMGNPQCSDSEPQALPRISYGRRWTDLLHREMMVSTGDLCEFRTEPSGDGAYLGGDDRK
jgi:hypothetical protein